jgi:hypothetical protein
MDAVHPIMNTKTSCGWIRIGTEKPIKTSGSRTRLNLTESVAKVVNLIMDQNL